MQNWIFILCLFIIIFYLFALYKKEKNKNKEIDTINELVLLKNKKIEEENQKILEKQHQIKEQYMQQKNVMEQIEKDVKNAEKISQKAFTNYCEVLDTEYQKKEKEIDNNIEILNKSYKNIQDQLIAETDQIRKDLDKISATRAAAIQAQLREQEIKEQENFYSLSIDTIDEKEIHILQSIESELRDPRPIRMIIWQTYYSKKVNELASKILGPNEITGIYKITSKKTGMCYIGQAKNIRERWREHVKCGLGIDTPANNKLYQAMKKEGVNNFTFELLEKCPAIELNNKENFYIQLYNSYHYGMNSNTGIKI